MIAKPLCACGYDATGLPSAVCPECGRIIAQRPLRPVPWRPVLLRGAVSAALNAIIWGAMLMTLRANSARNGGSPLDALILVVPFGLSVVSAMVAAFDGLMQRWRRRNAPDAVDAGIVVAVIWPLLLGLGAVLILAPMAI